MSRTARDIVALERGFGRNFLDGGRSVPEQERITVRGFAERFGASGAGYRQRTGDGGELQTFL